MDEELSLNDLDETVHSQVYTQDYSKEPPIEGVHIVTTANHVGEDGDFSEVLRIDGNGELEKFPGFKIAQINRSQVLPQMVKAWHVHLKQNEIWHVLPDCHLIAGLWDIRKDSPTKGKTMRLVFGGGSSKLVHIPKGVAHGYVNVSLKPATLIYFVSQHFNIENPDEKRLPWDILGADFWAPSRD